MLKVRFPGRSSGTSDDRMSIDQVERALEPLPDLVLVDCFGTLLHRTAPVETVRELAATGVLRECGPDTTLDQFGAVRREIEREWAQRSAAEGQARDHRLVDLAQEIHRRVQPSVELDRFVDLFCALELDAEIRLSRRNDDLVEALESIVPPDRVGVLSDTNLDEAMLRSLLEQKRAVLPEWKIVTSCDAGETKRSGALYRIVADERRADSRWVMIGDNLHADGEQASASLIEPLLIEPGRWDATRRAESRVLRREMSKQVSELLDPVDPDDVFPEYALTLYLFTVRLEESLRSSHSCRAVFLAREGAFLRQLFDALQSERSSPVRPAIPSSYLLTSRKSTLLPSLVDGAAGLEEFVANHPSTTVSELLGTLSIEVPDGFGDRLGEPAGSALPDLFGDDRLLDDLDSHHRQQVDLLRILVEDAAPGTGPVDLVDVGWRGTVRDQLARAFPDREFRVHLLGLINRTELDGADGLLFSNRPRRSPHYQLFSHFKELYELLLAAGHGSVARYQPRDDGFVDVVLDDDFDERSVFDRWIEPFQKRCLQRFTELRDVLAVEPADSEWLEQLMARHHARMMYRPRNEELDFVSQLGQRENFGASATRSPLDTAPTEASVRGPRRHVAGGGWPPLRMRAAGANWQRAPYAVYKEGQRMTGRLR